MKKIYEVRVSFPSGDDAPEGIRENGMLRTRWLHAVEELAFLSVLPSLMETFRNAGEVLEGTIPKPSRRDPRDGEGRVIEVRIPEGLAEKIAGIPGVYVNEI
ncbi:MAG: hypothetical protein H6862_03435 [Rhodospirillales bacterium]|nr:hypothetical protein [Rhodospirillales bacterium]